MLYNRGKSEISENFLEDKYIDCNIEKVFNNLVK